VFNPLKSIFNIATSAAYKFWYDDLFSRASSLAYTTLFSLLPLAAITFAVFRGFDIDEGQLERILESVLPPNEDELLTNLKTQVFLYLREFGESVRALSTVGIGIVVASGILLLNTIESALNVIWRVTAEFSVVGKIISFWAVLTLGPLLIVTSVYWWTRFSMAGADDSIFGSYLGLAGVILPTAAIWAALTLMYYKMPATTVRLKDAALGALFAAVLFEFTKRGFAAYISISTTYRLFYGVLVTIPLFLFWLYITWVVVLFGAEIAYQSGSIKLLRGLRKYASDLGEVGVTLGLRILVIVTERFARGEAPPTEAEITLESGSDPYIVRTCLDILSDAKLITVADTVSHTRSLVRSPDKVTIGHVVAAFHSKSYRKACQRDEEDSCNSPETSSSESEFSFITMIRDAGLKLEATRPVEDWTLTELLSDDRKT
jgi:membrane protein